MTTDRTAEPETAPGCPYCKRRPLETVATLPRVRGRFTDARLTVLTFVGCVPCVRGRLLAATRDACRSGWTSLAGLFLNPVFILYGLARALFVMPDPARVQELLQLVGITGPEAPPTALTTAYRLAASLIAADQRITVEELAVAMQIGAELFPDFDERAFVETLRQRNSLPPPGELAALLGTQIEGDAAKGVYRYLVAIATADQDVAPEERALLREIARSLGIATAGGGIDASV
ncbi:MAG: TerB family tellurite resistance protein [Methyloligellaceae bacterium]